MVAACTTLSTSDLFHVDILLFFVLLPRLSVVTFVLTQVIPLACMNRHAVASRIVGRMANQKMHYYYVPSWFLCVRAHVILP